MRNMNYLKSIFFTAVFAFTLNAATAQKSNKVADKAATQERIEQSQKLSAKEPTYKWVYSIALVTDHGGKFDIKFQDGKSKATEMFKHKSHEARKKTTAAMEEITSEADILNLLAELKMELISVVSAPGFEGRTMKYYLRTQITE